MSSYDDIPAYPVTMESRVGFDAAKYQGLSKRELFAAMAMQGYLAGNDLSKMTPEAVNSTPQLWVVVADRLIAELEKGKKE